ncbi:asparaginase domain-containing protein [Methanolobus sp. WCC4]|uniref:asparaginase n=1 Tax=Methanolobus sp. WCC4 TaxID=3125784 RepID=UPI0030F6320A
MVMTKLRIIYTGGTIGGKFSDSGDIGHDLTRKTFISTLSNKYSSLEDYLKKKDVSLSFDTPIREFSENLIPSDWSKLAKSVDNAINEGIDSIIIAHGTDTMCYSSAALSFMLQGIKIPVVFTGSNIPLEGEGTDAVTNMHDAFRVALDKRFKGVFLVFSGIPDKPSDIHLGCRVRKKKFYDNCFDSINTNKIGILKKNIFSSNYNINIVNDKLFNSVIEANDNKDYNLINALDEKISFFKVYPGFNPDLISYVVEKKTKAIILELYNAGTGCTRNNHSLIQSIKKANDIPVFITSQHEGNVLMDTYKTSLELKEAGAIPLRDMITEAAIPKLMWILKQKTNKDEIIDLMLTNVSGEIDCYEH